MSASATVPSAVEAMKIRCVRLHVRAIRPERTQTTFGQSYHALQAQGGGPVLAIQSFLAIWKVLWKWKQNARPSPPPKVHEIKEESPP
jgi:hypothetical protein